MPPGDDPDVLRRCSYCGDRLSADVMYPVAAEAAGDETVLHAFCDESCRSAWESDGGESAG